MASTYVCACNVHEIAVSHKVLGFMKGLLTFCSKLEKTNHGNGEGDTAAVVGITVKSHPPF